MNYRLIAVQAAILAVVAGLYFAVRRGPAAERTFEGSAPLLGEFPIDRIQAIRIRKAADTIELRKVRDEKEAGEAAAWVVASSMGYPARKSKIDELFDKVRGLKKGPVRAEKADLYGQFELDEKRETEVAFLDGAGKPLCSVHLGKTNYSMAGIMKQRNDPTKDESTTYARVNDDPKVLEIPGGHSVQTRASDWLDLDIFKEDVEKIEAVYLKGENGEIRLLRKEKPKEPPKEGEKKEEAKDAKPEFEWFLVKEVAGRGDVLVKAKKWAADSLVRSIASLTGSGVAEAMEIGKDEADVPEEQKKKYGFDNPCLTVKVWMGRDEKAETKTLLFGKVKRKKELKEGEKAEEGKDEEEVIHVYYPQKRSEFDIAMRQLGLGEEAVQKVQKVHVYTVESWTYNAVNKNPRDLKEEAEEAKDAFVKGVAWDEVSGFTIERGKDRVAVRKRVSAFALDNYGTEIWTSEGHWGCPVLTAKVETLMKDLKDLKLGDPTVPGAVPKEIGLDEESRTVVALLGAEGKEVFRFFAGEAKKVDSKEFTFLALPDQDPREVPGQHAFAADPAAWLDLRVFEFSLEDLVLFAVVKGEGAEVSLVKNRDPSGQERWLLRRKVLGRQGFEYAEADPENAANVAALLSRLSAKGVEKPVSIPTDKTMAPEEQLAPWGLHRPCLILAAVLADRQQLIVHIGKVEGQEDYFGYVPLARQPSWGQGGQEELLIKVWRLNRFAIDALAKGEDFFRKKEPKKEEGTGPGEKKGEGEKPAEPGQEKKEPGAGEGTGEKKEPGAGEAPGEKKTEEPAGKAETPGEAPGEKKDPGSTPPEQPKEPPAEKKG